MGGEKRVDEKHFFTRLGVCLYHRMAHWRIGGYGIIETLPATELTQAFLKSVTEIMDGNQILQVLLHSFRQPLIGGGHARKKRIAANFWDCHAS